ncbi:MAG TPA: hypothetical protein VGP22_02895 [Albitalea sp.]|nr:hypothetical protein [Albitalea sp.]
MPTRVEICPPALLRARPGWRERFVDWLAGNWPTIEADGPEVDVEPSRGATPLDSVRFEFVASLDDIATAEATDVAFRIQRARSLRELWHQRTEVFNIVSRHAGQHEATTRLQRLNRHFPARAPRSGFGGFDAAPQVSGRR